MRIHSTSKYLLNFTPTGMIPTKEMTSEVPVLPEEIVEQVLDAVALGANIIHLHARDPETGEPTYKKEIYRDIISGIRKKDKDVVLCVSTSGRTFNEFEKRSECLEINGELKPDFGSLTLSSLNFNNQASVSSPEMIKKLAAKMKENQIRPELEVFDLGMINYAHYLIKKGYITSPYYFVFILGNIACAQANLLSLGLMQKELPKDSIWSGGGVGDSQLKMNVMSLLGGGGVRVGLEDNIYFDTGRTKLATNCELVKRIVTIGEVLGFTPYTPKEARAILKVE